VPNYNIFVLDVRKILVAKKKKKLELSSSLEDYLEVIYTLSKDKGHAHSTEIAELLNVKKASVTGALRSLKAKGLVNYEPYGPAVLTKDGGKAAKAVAEKHSIIKSFFVNVLGIDKKTAQNAACKAEHALGPTVINRLLTFNEFLENENENGVDLVGRFESYISDTATNIQGRN